VVVDYEGTRVLVGPPGTGKSSYLTDRVPRIVRRSGRELSEESSPVLLCSLTNSAAAELGSRMPLLPSSVARTLHSHAYRSTESSLAVVDRRVVTDWNELHPLLTLTLPRARAQDPTPEDIVPAPRGDQHGDEVAAAYDRLRHELVQLDHMPERVRRFALRWEEFKRDRGVTDFTDMLVWASDAPPLDAEVIVVDEAQDLSRLGWQVVRAWADHAGGLLAVGDPWQALYDPWAGASAAAFLEQLRSADDSSILSQSWRVPAAVHRIAVRFVRQLSDFRPIAYDPRRVNGPGTPFVEGRVTRCDATWTDPGRAIDQAIDLAAQGKRVLFLFSANYMTLPLCQALRERVLPFSNPWRTHEPRWNPLRDGMGASAAALLDPGRRWTAAGLRGWSAPLRQRGLLRRGARAEIEAAAQHGGLRLGVDVLRGWFEPESFEGLGQVLSRGPDARVLRWWAERLLARHREAGEYAAALLRAHGSEVLDVEPLLHPSTIHASKGGEADCVFLFPDISPRADEAWSDGGRYRDPIVRAFYVGITRARECLYVCAPATRRFVELPR